MSAVVARCIFATTLAKKLSVAAAVQPDVNAALCPPALLLSCSVLRFLRCRIFFVLLDAASGYKTIVVEVSYLTKCVTSPNP